MKTAGWLERYIVVPENRSALDAVQSLAETVVRGESPDALIIYLHGNPGTGKTHLAHLFAEHVGSAQMVNAREGFDRPAETRVKRTAKDDLAEAPVLIVENVQFLPVTAVERLVEVLDRRARMGLPTLVTASAGPGQLRHRGERSPARLTSRFAGGLVVALKPMRPASRQRVLATWLADLDLDIEEDTIVWLAQKARGLRALESAIGQLDLLRRMGDGLPKLALIREHLEKHLDADKPSVDRIAGHVAGHFRVPTKEMRSRVRRRTILIPRQVSMYLARQLTPLSLQQIGAYFGGCDHTTVLHACRKVEQAIQDDAVLSGAVRQLHDELC